MKVLVEKREIDFAPGENTWGLQIFRETWKDVKTGKEDVYWKYGLPDGVQIFALTKNWDVIAVTEERNGITYTHCVGETMEEHELPATPESILKTANRGLLEETGYQAGSLEILCSILENSRKSERLIHHVLAQDCVPVGIPEEHIQVNLYEPFWFWTLLLEYLLTDPFSKHAGGNTLQAATLAFHRLGLLSCREGLS